jgi:hypothetical protein
MWRGLKAGQGLLRCARPPAPRRVLRQLRDEISLYQIECAGSCFDLDLLVDEKAPAAVLRRRGGRAVASGDERCINPVSVLTSTIGVDSTQRFVKNLIRPRPASTGRICPSVTTWNSCG